MANHKEPLLSAFLRRQRFKAALPHLEGYVLDWGCNVGKLAEHVSPTRYVGVDVDADCIQKARHDFPEHHFILLSEVDTLENDSFDSVAALALIEHVSVPDTLFQKWRSLLRVGGKTVLTTPHPRFEFLHSLGTAAGLLSREAREEHETLWDKDGLYRLAMNRGLKPILYRRFLFGANQLFIAQK